MYITTTWYGIILLLYYANSSITFTLEVASTMFMHLADTDRADLQRANQYTTHAGVLIYILLLFVKTLQHQLTRVDTFYDGGAVDHVYSRHRARRSIARYLLVLAYAYPGNSSTSCIIFQHPLTRVDTFYDGGRVDQVAAAQRADQVGRDLRDVRLLRNAFRHGTPENEKKFFIYQTIFLPNHLFLSRKYLLGLIGYRLFGSRVLIEKNIVLSRVTTDTN